MASESAILDVLLAGRSREFFERHYLKMPFCSAGGCETLRDYDRSAAERLALESLWIETNRSAPALLA